LQIVVNSNELAVDYLNVRKENYCLIDVILEYEKITKTLISRQKVRLIDKQNNQEIEKYKVALKKLETAEQHLNEEKNHNVLLEESFYQVSRDYNSALKVMQKVLQDLEKDNTETFIAELEIENKNLRSMIK
jgi:vacuolar-type H+-ATPase subunit I/STV1